jgi:hypothetical protein
VHELLTGAVVFLAVLFFLIHPAVDGLRNDFLPPMTVMEETEATDPDRHVQANVLSGLFFRVKAPILLWTSL